MLEQNNFIFTKDTGNSIRLPGAYAPFTKKIYFKLLKNSKKNYM
jgi:hypothetical protein